MSYRMLSVSVLALSLVSGACSQESVPAEVANVEVPGSCGDVFGSQVCTWATMNGETLVEVGATVPLVSIENAPADAPMAWPPVPAADIAMPLPALQQAGFTQLTVDWEAGGHPPATFMTPHFDYHFYLVPQAEIQTIDCTDESKPTTLPAGYELQDIPLPPEMASMIGVPTLVGVCVPKMGMHAVLASVNQQTGVFDGTMVIGYYHGTPIFVEPMISKATLMKRESFGYDVPRVPGLTGSQPTTFRAEYDQASDAYRFVLSGFTPAM